MNVSDQLDLWGVQWEAKQQAEVSAYARRIGSSAESLAGALRRSDRALLERLCADLLDCEDARLALSLFCDTTARLEH